MDYLQEQLERGHKFEQMMTTQGWELIKAYYTNKCADLANRMFTGDQPASDFQAELDGIRELRKLFESISHDVDVLNEQRNQQQQPIAEPSTIE